MESRKQSGSPLRMFDHTNADELEIRRLKKCIIENLTILKVSHVTIDKIFNTVENMRGSAQMPVQPTNKPAYSLDV